MRIRKRRGIFYTPAELAQTLTAWAVRSATDAVLEPSFGGCGFIAALRDRFVELGHARPFDNIFGCDVDGAAIRRHLPAAMGTCLDQRHFRKADFLSLNRRDFGGIRFDAVVGNPPYVSHHNMFKRQRVAAGAVGADDSFRLSGMASLWAYFVLHSLTFLREGGRMAWLLPGSLLHADYAKELLHELGRRFGRVAVISLRERVFLADDVSETTEVLLCDNYNAREHRDVELITATGVDACAVLLKGWHDKKWTGVPLNGRAVRALSAPEELVVFDKICRNNVVATLGSVARINIGIVTGANHFFIVEQDFAREHSIPNEALKPIFAKSRMTPGIQLTSDDIEAAKKCGISCLLIDGARTDHFPAVLSYFAAVPAAARTGNVTFRKRIDWRTPDDNRIPDAFFPYMHHLGPRLIMNISRVNATNTIHRVYFKQPVSVSCQKLVALALLSTFSQLSAEIEGRSYGGGVLKHEPTEASNIRLLLPQRMPTKAIAALFDKVDSLLRQGLPLKATLAVDSAIIASMPTALPRDEWRSMEEALLRLRRRRHLTKV